MLPWWVTALAFIIGGAFGAFLLALCAAGDSDAERRWKDGQRE